MCEADLGRQAAANPAGVSAGGEGCPGAPTGYVLPGTGPRTRSFALSSLALVGSRLSSSSVADTRVYVLALVSSMSPQSPWVDTPDTSMVS